MRLMPIWLFFYIYISIAPASLLAAVVSGTIDVNTTWVTGDSPYQVDGVVSVAFDITLTIEPGVIVEFSHEAALIVDGNLVARGTERDSIRFTSSGADTAGSWDGIALNGTTKETSWNAKGEFTGIGSVMSYCVIEYAGRGLLALGSALSINSSSPLIEHSTIINCAGETGTIRCGNLSRALIQNCLITQNIAIRGGAVSLGVGSKTVLQNNVFAFNTAEDNGGAIYLSIAEADILKNSFMGNKAGGHGGVIFAAKSSHLLITGNTMIGNSAEYDSPGIYFTGEVQSEIISNVVEIPRNAIYLQGALIEVNAASNYWGRPDTYDFRTAFRDKNHDSAEPFVYYNPALWAPPLDMPTNPVAVNKIILCRSDAFNDEIPRGVADGAPLRIRLDGEDINQFMPDVIQVKVVSTLDPDGILLPLYETGAATGVFIGSGSVGLASNQQTYTIGDEIGGTVIISAPFAPDVTAEYATMSAKPLVEEYNIPQVEDIQHLVDHKPRIIWTYFEVVERPQTHYRFRVFNTGESGEVLSSPLWDTGEFASSAGEIDYAGPKLQDGESYVARLELYSSYLWSDPVDLPFRMNSLPTAPMPISPEANWLSTTKTPQLTINVSEDKEADKLVYSFEIFAINNMFSAVQSVNSILPAASVVNWSQLEPLMENEGYEFRAKADDPFESGPWGDRRRFWINSLEEPADAFELVSPIDNNTIYPLQPRLTWTEAVDPDPLSSVTYRVEISKSSNFSNRRTYKDIVPLNFTLPDSLDNRTTYYWRTTSVDNTGLETRASSVQCFHVDTTPSVPISIAPLDGEERLPTASLSWESSTDPDPADLIVYDIEIYKTKKLINLMAHSRGWYQSNIRVEELDNWENLIDNQSYFWQVRARDNHNADSKYGTVGLFFYNRYNDNPEPVSGLIAPADTVMGTSDIRFAWGAASDIDLSDTPETLVYEVEAVIGSFDTGQVREFTTSAGATKITVRLDDNRLWRYRVRATDDEGAVSTWSAEKTVLVNVAEDHPELFNQNSPMDNSPIAELDSILFTWESSKDKDWESSVHYRLELSPADGNKFVVETDQTSYMYYGGLTNESNYSWQIVAIDNLRLETNSNGAHRFSTNTTPTTPSAAHMAAELLPTGLIAFDGSTDPNPNDRLSYILEVAANETFDQPLIHLEKISHSDQTITSVIGRLPGQEKLADDTDYFFQVRVVDNHGYRSAFSAAAKFRFNRENDAPGMPGMPFSPGDDQVVRTQRPMITWSAASDIDLSDPSETLAYDIRLDSDGELEINSRHEFTTSPGVTQYTLPVSLDDDLPWVWQIRTRDNEGAVSSWAARQSCLINVQEDPPTSVVLSNPSVGQKLNVLGPIKFNWNASTDPDYKSSVQYRLEYDTAPDFQNPVTTNDLKGLSTMVNGPLLNTTYYWRVVAVDNTGLETVSSSSNVVLDTRPSVPETSSPLAGSELLPAGVLSWMSSVDPNPDDRISYSVQIGVGSASSVESSDKTVEQAGLTKTSLSLENAGWIADEIAVAYGDNITCFWRVKAIDNHGIMSDWSTPSEFVLNAINDPPAQVKNVISPAEYEEVSSVTMSWEAVDDPDLTDTPATIAYRVELSKDMGFSMDVITVQTAPGVTKFVPENLTDNSEWFWLITPIDDEGLVGSVSNIFSFIYNIENDDPDNFSLNSPANNSIEDSATFAFSWSQALDPDPGDEVSYTLTVAKNAAFSIGKKRYSGIRFTHFKPPESDFDNDETYFWKVSADDGEGGFTWAENTNNAPWSFTVKLPPPPALSSPSQPPAVGGQ